MSANNLRQYKDEELAQIVRGSFDLIKSACELLCERGYLIDIENIEHPHMSANVLKDSEIIMKKVTRL